MGIGKFFSSMFGGKTPKAWQRATPAAVGPMPEFPWTRSRKNIHEHLMAYAGSGPFLPEEARRLPDEEEYAAARAGCRDAEPGADPQAAEKAADEAFALLERVLKKPSVKNVAPFYEFLVRDTYFDYLDPLIRRIVSQPLDIYALERLGGTLVYGSPDRKPVQLGIALLGLLNTPKYSSLFTMLGRHAEFTLYAVVALLRTLPLDEAEERLWQLAGTLDDQERVHAIGRLLETKRADIKGSTA